MLRFNHHTHTLEQADYEYDLHDVKDANLFRDIYSYGEVPKIAFNQRLGHLQRGDAGAGAKVPARILRRKETPEATCVGRGEIETKNVLSTFFRHQVNGIEEKE